MISVIVIISIIVVVIIVGVTVSVINGSINKRYEQFTIENSACLGRLKEINSRYTFYPYISFNQTHIYDNEKFYDTVSCADYLIYQLQFIDKEVLNQIEKTNINKRLYPKYIEEINKKIKFGDFGESIGKLKFDKLVKIEKKLFERQIYGAPCMQVSLTVTLRCSRMNGQVYRGKYANFSADEIIAFIERLHNKSGTFFNDRGIWDALCRVERAKVSNKMRFSIYSRDGYRCCRCGVSHGYADLEIDHIKPIAKGGKSTYDNLQTLCHKCNKEKGSNWY